MAVMNASSPATGGFLLHVTGTDLSAHPSVTVGGLPCPIVALVPHLQVSCTAPPMLVGVQPSVVIVADGQAAEAGVLTYDAPEVMGIAPNIMHALPLTPRPRLYITGERLGSKTRNACRAFCNEDARCLTAAALSRMHPDSFRPPLPLSPSHTPCHNLLSPMPMYTLSFAPPLSPLCLFHHRLELWRPGRGRRARDPQPHRPRG
jgi:hypothetical protein